MSEEKKFNIDEIIKEIKETLKNSDNGDSDWDEGWDDAKDCIIEHFEDLKQGETEKDEKIKEILKKGCGNVITTNTDYDGKMVYCMSHGTLCDECKKRIKKEKENEK
ncbi:MAG: hypothetical protein ACOC1P_02850 [Minisyncoccales bacterium]